MSATASKQILPLRAAVCYAELDHVLAAHTLSCFRSGNHPQDNNGQIPKNNYVENQQQLEIGLPVILHPHVCQTWLCRCS